ncbi:MAG: hypothetical protein KC505_03455 [Myxococcales bacterium]|nr:hypothetical protein [Myxococcales bacterium]USN51556.1 MAG: hypothetical protein H6731_03875 [Myxococcales bacterium]
MNILISGAEHQDRMNHAKELAMVSLCLDIQNNKACQTCNNCERILTRCHPNLTYIEPLHNDDAPEKNSREEIKIEQVRRIIFENQKANYEKGTAIFIITHMHQITKAAANALLKSIEESGDNKSFFCLAPSRSSVLPTIASRLISVPIKPAALLDSPDEKTCQLIHAINKLSPNKRFKICGQFSSQRAELYQELENMREQCHILLRSYSNSATSQNLHPSLALHISQALNNACTLLERNINPRLVVEQLLLREWPCA